MSIAAPAARVLVVQPAATVAVARNRRWQRLKKNQLSMLGGAIIVILALVAVFGPFVAPYPRDASGAVHVSSRLQAPDGLHWFGTDEVGRDILTRILFGARVSLGAGLLVLVSATVLGTTLGLISSYVGGMTDLLLQRVTDVFLTVPGLILAL